MVWRIEQEWTISGQWAIRYYNPVPRTHFQIQVSKYREADDFDKSMHQTYKWHGKWYVQIWPPEKEYLFQTKEEALAFAKKYMRRHSK